MSLLCENPSTPKGLSKYPGKKKEGIGGGFRDVRSETPLNPHRASIKVLLFPLFYFLKDTQVSDKFILIESCIFHLSKKKASHRQYRIFPRISRSRNFFIAWIQPKILIKTRSNVFYQTLKKLTWAEVKETIVDDAVRARPARKQRETRSGRATGTNWLVSSRACGLEDFGKIRPASVLFPEAVY